MNSPAVALPVTLWAAVAAERKIEAMAAWANDKTYMSKL